MGESAAMFREGNERASERRVARRRASEGKGRAPREEVADVDEASAAFEDAESRGIFAFGRGDAG